MHTPIANSVDQQAIADDIVRPTIKLDYRRDLAMTESDQPGGRIVFSTADYETDEAADAAFEAFVTKSPEEPYDDEEDL
jgi:hypothetical protein